MMASYLDCQLHSRLAYVCRGVEGRDLNDTIVACAFKRGQRARVDSINASPLPVSAAGAASAEQSREASARPRQQGQVARRQQGILPSPDPPTF